tara:strand:+ start:1978 stop:2184 length:207 start_codon:yes stop_codon:yes gene_type:complete
METIILLSALVHGIYHIEKSKEPPEASSVQQEKLIYNEGIEEIDWSKAGNFRTASTENNVQWVIITEG